LKTTTLLEDLLIVAPKHQSKAHPLESEMVRLKELLAQLVEKKSYVEKIVLLDELAEVQDRLASPSPIRSFIAGLSQDCEYVIKSVFAIKQGSQIFSFSPPILNPIPHYRQLLEDLLVIENFYQDIGGIIGYQCLVLSLLVGEEENENGVAVYPPQGIDLSNEETPSVRHAILEGIKSQKTVVEFYPVGGAADRLQLKDQTTGQGLPAACLVFQGKHLLKSMIQDLQAREYLHYKLFDAQVTTPVVLMTSKVHHNHDYVKDVCLQNKWFGRPSKSFRFMTQPSVPVFTKEGNWCLQKPLKLLLRPGGHGVIWKLAKEKEVFTWLRSCGKTKGVVRQINNPMASVDYGLTAFLGIGYEHDKTFGFASCERRVNAHEGMVVLKEISLSEKKEQVLTNIEYCDFQKYGIKDIPKDETSSFSLFPSNTNILFVDLDSVRKAVETVPFPGLLVNFRMGAHYLQNQGAKKEKLARLETTMQNIADAFREPASQDRSQLQKTYVTFNHRRKTISTTKRQKSGKDQLLETPEGCFYDFMQNAQELLSEKCGMKLAEIQDETAFLKQGPPFLFNYHPALGPLYRIIQQKIQGGELSSGAELQLEIADLSMHTLFLKGSLLIFAENVMGHEGSDETVTYSSKTGQCILENVRVENQGINWGANDHLFWKHEISRKESLTIRLKGHSRFEARNITFKGNQTIEVPDGMHMIAREIEGKLTFETHPFFEETPFWSYEIDAEERICLYHRSSVS
jgi:hypothetical protein